MTPRTPLLVAGAVGLALGTAWLAGALTGQSASQPTTPLLGDRLADPTITRIDGLPDHAAASAAARDLERSTVAAAAPPAPQVEPTTSGTRNQRGRLRMLRHHARSIGLDLDGQPLSMMAWHELDKVHDTFEPRLDEVMTARAMLISSISKQRHSEGQLERIVGNDRTTSSMRTLNRAMRPQFQGQLISMVADATGSYVCRVNPHESASVDELSSEVEMTLTLYVDAARNFLD